MRTTSRTITMSTAAPVRIDEDEWLPQYVSDTGGGRKRHITFRTNIDGVRAIVYAVQKKDGEFKAEHAAGYLCKASKIAETIIDVAEEMEDKTGGDWMPLADQLIRRLKPTEI